MMRPGLFLDRDGVIVREVDLLTRADEVELLAGVPEAIARAQGVGWAVVVVSNQTVVARGLCSEEALGSIHRGIEEALMKAGCAPLDGWYFCPHHPHADVASYRLECTCRKPKPGMLLRAAKDLGLDLEASVMVGDRLSDIAAGAAAGCETILVRSGAHAAPPIVGMEAHASARPTFECDDLASAINIIEFGALP